MPPARCPGRPPPVRWPACPPPSDCPPATVAACFSRRPANGGGARSPSGQWTHHSAQGAGGLRDGAEWAPTPASLSPARIRGSAPPFGHLDGDGGTFPPLSRKSQSLRAPGLREVLDGPRSKSARLYSSSLAQGSFCPSPALLSYSFQTSSPAPCPGASCPCPSFYLTARSTGAKAAKTTRALLAFSTSPKVAKTTWPDGQLTSAEAAFSLYCLVPNPGDRLS